MKEEEFRKKLKIEPRKNGYNMEQGIDKVVDKIMVTMNTTDILSDADIEKMKRKLYERLKAEFDRANKDKDIEK